MKNNILLFFVTLNIYSQGFKTEDTGQTFKIPIVFHMLDSKLRDGDISDNVFTELVKQLNKKINTPNSVFLSSIYFKDAKGLNIEFYLPDKTEHCEEIDPITWTYTSKDFYPAKTKEEILEPFFDVNYPKLENERFLNIYFAKLRSSSGSVDGYYKKPNSIVKQGLIVIDWSLFFRPQDNLLGTPNKVSEGVKENNSMAFVLAHEIGHYFSLSHPWGNDYFNVNPIISGCNIFQGDSVDDTLKQSGPNEAFNSKRYNTATKFWSPLPNCGTSTPSNYQNFMDYSYGAPYGYGMFTKGQVKRMRKHIIESRQELVNTFSNSNKCNDCSAPTNLNITNIKETTATFNWTSSNANGYEIELRIANGSWNPIASAISTANSWSLSGLKSNTKYEVRIKGICSKGTENSNWANISFTTEGNSGNPPPNDACNNATTLTSSTSCNYTSGTVKDATPSVGANNCMGSGTTSPDDYDVFYKFTAVATSHTVKLSNYASNFDAVIELRRACSSGSNNYISCYDPTGSPTFVSKTWDDLTIGQTYYIRVFEWNYKGTPPNKDTFDICVTHKNSNTDGIDLISDITSVSNDNPDAGDQITVNYSVTNNGDEIMTTNTTSALYLSTNQSYDSSDVLISGSVYALTTNLAPNQSKNIASTLTIPNVNDGQYYIISYPNLSNLVSESNNKNNTDAYAIQIGDIVQDGPDLDVTGLKVIPNSGLVPGQEVDIEIEIDNKGNKDANSFDVLVFLDIDRDGEYDENEYMGEFNFGSIDSDEDKTMTVDLDLPTNITSTGVYELFVIADSNNDINETDEGNNDKDRNITIALIGNGVDDFTVINSTVSKSSVNAGATIDVTSNHIYLGNQTSNNLPSIHLGYYLSTDSNFSYSEDIFLDDDSSNLGSNNPNVDEQQTLTIPSTTPSGTYYILFVADSENIINEGTLENNNVEPIEITINGSSTPKGDIYITDKIANPKDVIVGSEIEVFTNINYLGNQTRNQIPNIEVYYFLSNDCVLSNDDIFLDDTGISLGSDLPINDVNKRLKLPANNSSGTYYIMVRVDMKNGVYETNENNNITCVEFNLLPADSNYQDVTLNNPYVDVTEANVGDQIYASVFQNYTGYQTDSDLSSIKLKYYLSSDCTFSTDDIELEDDFSGIGSDDPSELESETITIPTSINTGDYYILFVADTENIVVENNENNNVVCLPITINDGSLSVDINELNEKIKIFPNPVNNILTVSLGENFRKTNIEIFNLIGQKVKIFAIQNKESYEVSMYSLPDGVYIIRIKIDGKQIKEFKVIKQ